MNGLQVFENGEFGRVRVIELDGDPWFVGKDVAGKLGYAETANMRKLLDEDDYIEINPQSKRYATVIPFGFEPNPNIKRMLLISEGGLYMAMFSSHKDKAKRCKRWFFHEALPSMMED